MGLFMIIDVDEVILDKISRTLNCFHSKAEDVCDAHLIQLCLLLC